MRSPIKFRKHLVAKAPKELKQIDYNYNVYMIKELDIEDIENDKWLIQRESIFKKMLNDGHIGIIALNENNECIAYSFIAIANLKPNHIPKKPENSAWIHYNRVKDDYQGKGIHRLLMQKMVTLIRERYGVIDIYGYL